MMKIKFKENKFIILSFIIMSIILCYSIVSYNKDFQTVKKAINETINECKVNNIEEREELCAETLKEAHEVTPDFYYSIIVISSNMSFISLAVFIIVTFSTLYCVCNIFKSRNIIYRLTRENYKKFKKRLFIESYKPVLILPIIFAIIIVFSLIYCKGINTNSYFSDILIDNWDKKIISPYLYIITLIIKPLLISIIYINISLIIARKNHKFYLSVILSYLLFIAIEIFLEGVIGNIIFNNLLKIDSMIIYTNLINIFSLNLSKGYIAIYTPLIIILIITSIIVYIMYKDKEKLIIDCDKNL